MLIQLRNNRLTSRVSILEMTAEDFPEERFLTLMNKAFSSGGEITMTQEDTTLIWQKEEME